MNRDPVQFRLALLSPAPRLKAVLGRAAELAGWGRQLPPNRARGVAIHPSKDSFVAQVAEVSAAKTGEIRVHNIVCIVDCGLRVNPDTARAQIEGAIVWGLTATIKGRISVRDGAIEQANYVDYPILRIDETPQIQIEFIASGEPPGGIGEIGVPPVAPAVSNAVFALTGRRPRHLPIDLRNPAAATNRDYRLKQHASQTR
jgi:isoquinoline 1-oxidoreductase beta subunit